MKTNILLIRIGGAVSVFFLLFHLTFYWLFDWKNTLACLNLNNWAIYHTFNIIADILLLFFVIVSLGQPEKLVTEINGRRIILLMVVFYSTRIVAEFIFWGYSGLGSIIIILMCLAPIILYGIPYLKTKNSRL